MADHETFRHMSNKKAFLGAEGYNADPTWTNPKQAEVCWKLTLRLNLCMALWVIGLGITGSVTRLYLLSCYDKREQLPRSLRNCLNVFCYIAVTPGVWWLQRSHFSKRQRYCLEPTVLTWGIVLTKDDGWGQRWTWPLWVGIVTSRYGMEVGLNLLRWKTWWGDKIWYISFLGVVLFGSG